MTTQPSREDLGNLQGPRHFAHVVESEDGLSELLVRLAEVAGRILRVPLVQVNVFLGDEQHSLSSVAPGPVWSSLDGPRAVPARNSYCQHVIRSGEPLVIEDASAHVLVRDNPATTEMGIRSYAAIPLKNRCGDTLATLCVVDDTPRAWDPSDLEALSALADLLMREVRGRAEAEEELRRSEERFRSLIENGADLITVLTSDGRITYQSPAYGKVLGYEPDSLMGTDFRTLVHPSGRDRWERVFFTPLAAGKDEPTAEWRMRSADGEWRTVRGGGVNLQEDPAVRGLVLNIHDITQERQLESELHQAQKMEAVGRLAGGVAHDFNNLLTAIQGNTDFLLSRGDLSPEAAEDVRQVAEVCARAAGLSRQLLTFSRDQVLELEVLDLGELTEETVSLVKRLIGVGTALETSFQRELFVEGDAGQLGQVIMNLAVNARDAMTEGGTLRLEARAFTASEEYALSHGDMSPGEYALLVVADTGVGMTREVQKRIFEPFFTTKGAHQGTGLGLSICWGIVKQVGGHIHLYSEPGHGTVFRIFLPRVGRPIDSASDSAFGLRAGEAPPSAGPVSGTILVVDDEPEVRRVVARVLRAEGHDVLEAGSAERALEIAVAEGGSIDLLLTDVLLPGRSGAELAWELARDRPGLAIGFTSGFTRGELSEQSVDLRNAAFLPKPFGPRALSRFVSEVLSADHASASR